MNVTTPAETLESFLSYLDPLVDESKLHFDAGELHARAVDPANVAMADITLSAAAFENYEAADVTLGVNLDRLEDYISMADSDEIVTLELDEQTRKLHIEYGTFESTMALIDPETIRAEPDLPDLDLPAEVVLEGRALDRGVSAADMVADHLRFGVDAGAEEFTVTAEGDTDDVSLTLGRSDLIDLTPGDAASLYSVDYIKDQTSPIDADTEVRMELGEEFPMKMHLEYADGAGALTYMTAPRISSD